MSFVRSRVEEFEKSTTSSKDQDHSCTSAGRKKFLYPGRQRQSNSVTRGGAGEQAPVSNSTRLAAAGSTAGGARNKFETVFESELEEVWSVRRNVHHNSMATGGGNMATTTSSNDLQTNRGARSYSRHNQSAQLGYGGHDSRGAPPVAAPAGLVGSDRTRRFPLQDHNHNHQMTEPTARRLDTSRTPFYSSDTTPKRLNHSPTGDSPPSAKKKVDGPHHWMQQQQPSATPAEVKVSYAKRMAQAHMKSVGIGSFTPQQDGYSQHSTGQGRVHWQKHDSTDDEFSF